MIFWEKASSAEDNPATGQISRMSTNGYHGRGIVGCHTRGCHGRGKMWHSYGDRSGN